MPDIKAQTLHGVKWTAINKFSSTIVGFIIGVVLARLLTPADYGTVGMIGIFFAIAGVFTDSGFGMALVRAKTVSEEDLSTVFYFNIGMSVLCYAVLFFAAPFIADFFNMPMLKDLVRISGLTLVIGSIGGVQYKIMTRNVNFKIPAMLNVIAQIISGIVGITCAYMGMGAWALVISSITSMLIRQIGVWFYSSWRPKLLFSKDSFHRLFSFGSKVLASNLLSTLFSHIQSLLIGKFYTPHDLGVYSKGHQTSSMPVDFIYGLVGGVTLPILSRMQDDDELLLRVYRKYIKVCSLLTFFCLVLVCALAKPLIVFLYTDKWLPAVIFVQIFCFSDMFYHIHAINVNLLLAKGRSDLNLRIEIIKRSLTLFVLLVVLPFGLLPFCIAGVVTGQLALLVNTYYTKRLFNYGYIKQWADFLPYLLLAFIACIPAFLLVYVGLPHLLTLILGTVVSAVLYFGVLLMKKDEYLRELILISPLKKFINGSREKKRKDRF